MSCSTTCSRHSASSDDFSAAKAFSFSLVQGLSESLLFLHRAPTCALLVFYDPRVLLSHSTPRKVPSATTFLLGHPRATRPVLLASRVVIHHTSQTGCWVTK